LTLAEDGKLTIVETADETGAPVASRLEGTWSTDGNRLTFTFIAEGPNSDNLQPLNPRVVVRFTYAVFGDTFTTSVEDEQDDTFLTTYRRI